MLVLVALLVLVAGVVGGTVVGTVIAARRARLEVEDMREAWIVSEGHLRGRLTWHEEELGRLEESLGVALEVAEKVAHERDEVLEALVEHQDALALWRTPNPN